jgi:hypothetical protein
MNGFLVRLFVTTFFRNMITSAAFGIAGHAQRWGREIAPSGSLILIKFRLPELYTTTT